MEPNNLLSYINCIKLLENYFQHKNFSITSIVVESLNETVSGMMAEYYKLIMYLKIGEENVQQNFFCKKLIMFHKIQEIMGKAQGAYEKEEFIYKKFCEDLQKIGYTTITFAPRCYLTLNHDIFILDELIERGYGVNHKDFDLEHFQIGLKSIAEFHACSIILEETKGINLKEANPQIIFADSLYRKNEDYLGRHWFKNCLQSVTKIVDVLPELPLPKSEIKAKLERFSILVYDIISPSTKFRNVCCHGDLSKLNILFQYKENLPVDSKIVDFQALRYNPPAHDVVNFIYLCSSYKFRCKYLNDLTFFYYKCLEEKLLQSDLKLSEIIPETSFLESVKFILPQAILQKLFYNTMNPVIRLFPHILKDQDLYKKYVYEDRSEECLQAYEMSSTFRELMIENFIEFCKIES